MITLAFMAYKFTSVVVGREVSRSVNKNDHFANRGTRWRDEGYGIRVVVIKNTVYISTQDVAFNADVSKKKTLYRGLGGYQKV